MVLGGQSEPNDILVKDLPSPLASLFQPEPREDFLVLTHMILGVGPAEKWRRSVNRVDCPSEI
jgi:hypothetical protein